ncbi:MAG: helix-turn-helix transcriptional regulator [Pyrinomonadaceae bacterium]
MNEVFEKLMQDDTIRKGLGQRIKQLRKDKGWTQKELANRIGTSPAQLNKYEASHNTPPLDKLILFAEVLTTTADYLITGNLSENVPISNTRLVQRLQLIDQFEPEEKETAIKLLDALIAKHNMESTVRTLSDATS